MNVQLHSLSPETERRRILLPSPTSRSPLLPPLRPDRVVTLAALSDRVPDHFISETFSHTLRAETGATGLLVHMEPTPGRLSSEDWVNLLPRVNGEFALGRHLETTEGGIAILRLQVPSETTEEDFLASLITHCTGHFQYVVLHT